MILFFQFVDLLVVQISHKLTKYWGKRRSGAMQRKLRRLDN